MPQQAVGVLETKGLAAALAGADAGAKAAGVSVLRRLKAGGSALIDVVFEGEVAAVQAALDAAAAEARKVGEVVGMTVIPRPGDGMDVILETGAPKRPTRKRRASKTDNDTSESDNGG